MVAFGCFVEVLPGKEGLVHVSELDVARIADVAACFKEGDVMDVKLVEINDKGQLRLSRKAVMLAAALEATGGQTPAEGAPSDGEAPAPPSPEVAAARAGSDWGKAGKRRSPGEQAGSRKDSPAGAK